MNRTERKALVASIVEPYLVAKKDQTIRSQYERVAPGPDGRIRTVLSPVVTVTGRLASGESFVDPASTNLQNLSKKEGFKDPLYRVRDTFTADPGMTLLAIDFQKGEAVVAAIECMDWAFYQALLEERDTHSMVAAEAFHGGNVKAVTKHQRQVSKNVFFASLYRAGIPRITRTINADASTLGFRLTEAEVKVVWEAVMRMLPLQEWWDRVWEELMDPDLYGGTRWLANALGFRRMFYNDNTYRLHTEAINFFPQSTVATRIDEVMIHALEHHEEEGKCEFLLQVHDELLWQVADEKALFFAKVLMDAMEARFEARGQEVYLPAEASLGKRWGSIETIPRVT